MIQIVIDDREKAVFDYLDIYQKQYTINYHIKRLNIGDYAIYHDNKLICIVERKTWKDLAASFTDGRKNNVFKLLDLRKETQCKIVYLIEGHAFPNRKHKVNNFPYKNLIAHLDHLIFRDGIHVIYSKDEDNTVMRLFELAKNYSTIKEPVEVPVEVEVPAETIVYESDSDMTLDDVLNLLDTKDTKVRVESKHGGDEKAVKTPDIELLTKKKPSVINIREQMLRTLPNIGSVISGLLVQNGLSLPKLVLEDIDINFISELKYSTGAQIGIDRAKKILNISKLIKSDKITNYKINLLASIPLITKKTAKIILEEYKLIDIIKGKVKVKQLKEIKKTEKTKLGEKASENIVEYLTK